MDTTTNNFPSDYNTAEVDSRVLLRSKSVRNKAYGKDIREALAQGIEISSAVSRESSNTATEAKRQSQNIDDRFNDQIAGSTNDNEVIDFRHSDMLSKSFTTSKLRGDFFDNEFQQRAVNVKWLGATGDGQMDDTSAIQKALDSEYNSIYIPSGTYILSKSLSIPSNKIFFGLGANSILKQITGQENGIVTETNAENILIHDIHLIGNDTGSQPANVADDPDVSNAGSGIVGVGTDSLKIFGCEIEHFGGDGSTDTEETDGVAGIWLTYGCKNSVAKFNKVHDCRNGINEDNYFGEDPFYNKIEENLITNCRFGIVSDNTENSRAFYFTKNTILDCKYSGIDIAKSGYGIISENYISRCGNTGTKDSSGNAIYARAINVYGSSSGSFVSRKILVKDNILENNYGDAIGVVQNTQFARIEKNTIISNAGSGIVLKGARFNQVLNNIIELSGSYGIVIDSMIVNSTEILTDNSLVKANIIKDSGKHGIYGTKSQTNIFSGNNISNSGTSTAGVYYDLLLATSSNNNIVNGNILSGSNIAYALGIVSTSISNTISENQFVTSSSKKMQIENIDQQFFSNNGSSHYSNSLDLRTTNQSLILKNNGLTGTIGEIAVDVSTNKIYVQTNTGVKSVDLT